MEAGSQSPTTLEPERETKPEISVCESCPDKVVFLKSGNNEGWISSTVTVDVTQ